MTTDICIGPNGGCPQCYNPYEDCTCRETPPAPPAPAENDRAAIYAALVVSNVDDALAAIKGLQQRVRFTADYETLRLAALSPRSEGTTPAPATPECLNCLHPLESHLNGACLQECYDVAPDGSRCGCNRYQTARSPGAVPEARPHETTKDDDDQGARRVSGAPSDQRSAASSTETAPNAGGQPIDVRYVTLDDNGECELDEIVATGCTVHLEKMNDRQFYLGIDTPRESVKFWISAKGGEGGEIVAVEYDRESLAATTNPKGSE